MASDTLQDGPQHSQDGPQHPQHGPTWFPRSVAWHPIRKTHTLAQKYQKPKGNQGTPDSSRPWAWCPPGLGFPCNPFRCLRKWFLFIWNWRSSPFGYIFSNMEAPTLQSRAPHTPHGPQHRQETTLDGLQALSSLYSETQKHCFLLGFC